MRRVLVFVCLLCDIAVAKQYPMGWEYSNPPSDDEFLTNRFGRSWSDPIYDGYLVVDDHYVDAPYVVEQRGFVIFVNNERVQDGTDIRFVLPRPEPEPVTSDPGLPTGVTRTTEVIYVFMDPVSVRNQRYWDYLGLKGQDRIDAFTNFLRRLPCVSNVVDYAPGYRGTRQIRIYDFVGNEERFYAPLQPRVVPVHDDKGQCTQVVRQYGEFCSTLARNRHVYIRNAGLRSHGPGPSPEEYPKWYASFRTLESPYLTATQRLERLRQLRMISQTDDLIYCDGTFPMNGFHTSSQLWQRLSGDMSWTNDAPTRLLALTNGWQKIIPAFMRTQNVAVVTGVAAGVTSSATHVTTMSNALPTMPTVPTVTPTNAEHSVTSVAGRRIWLAAALAGILVLGSFLTRRVSRKRDRGNRPQD